MKRSKISGWFDLISLVLLSITQLILALFFPLLYRIVFLTISSIMSLIVISAALASFLKRHIKTRKMFIKGKYGTKIVHDLGPISVYLNLMYTIFIFLLSLLFSFVFLYDDINYIPFEELNLTLYLLILTLWIGSGIITIIATIIYSEELSQKDLIK